MMTMEKCYICKKQPGEVKCVIVVKGEKITRRLCADCAREAGFAEQLKLNRRVGKPAFKITADKPDVFCPDCKLSFSQFLVSGLFGCPACYRSFKSFISDILKGIHSATYHRGRGPGKDRSLDLSQLKWKLSEAVVAEDFERAAEIRDEISRIERESN